MLKEKVKTNRFKKERKKERKKELLRTVERRKCTLNKNRKKWMKNQRIKL